MGLVSGLSATQALSRVSSAGIGGSACIDVLHDAADLKARYLPIPREMNDGLTAVATLVGKAGGRSPEYLGVAEGKLHYTLPENPGGPSVRSMFERAVGRRFPGLPLVEVVPRAVLDA
ncbi:MAG: hypothetical protein HY795_18530 [Desulfovibrio sp.]|nr:hypothetical protein [Desulfovibrio sp.]